MSFCGGNRKKCVRDDVHKSTEMFRPSSLTYSTQVQELRVEMQQLKAKNHGLNTQMDALAVDHERLAGLLSTAQNVRRRFQIFFSPCLGSVVLKLYASCLRLICDVPAL